MTNTTSLIIKESLNHFSVTIEDLNKVIAEAMAQGADFSDLYFEHSKSNSLVLQDGEVNRVSSHIDYGAGIRALDGEKTGFAFVENTELKDLLQAAKTASNIAKASTSWRNPSSNKYIQVPSYYSTQQPWIDVTIERKKTYLDLANKLVFDKDKRVIKATIALMESSSRVLIYNSLGEISSDVRPMVTMFIRCVMEQDGQIESGSSSRSFRMGGEFLTNEIVETIVNESLEQTSRLFGAKRPKGGEMPVVMAAGESGILLHEAIGHAFEADFNRKKTSIFSEQLGNIICNKDINIIDDGTLQSARGSINIDDEGIEGQKTYIIKNGRLESFLHDRISAKHYALKPTGNGRRESFRHIPLPRMRVTYMENGSMDEKDIISSVKRGIYVDDFTNGQVQIGAGDFTFYVKTGYLIENGKLTQPIKDINIIGNGPKALADISMVGNNLKISQGSGTCGKDGQSVPVGYGLPTVLVNNLTVGGE